MLKEIIRPMEPKLHPQIFQSQRYRYQVKWDGVRMLAFINEGKLRLQNRRLHERTDRYLELASLPLLLEGKEAILDGEVVVMQDGKPNFARVLERDLAAKKENIRRLAKRTPVVFIVFDLLYYQGKKLTDLSWEKRQDLLFTEIAPLFKGNNYFHCTESFSDGPALWEAVKEKEMEGVVAKRIDSPYLPGRKSDYWLKIKVRRKRSCVVGGYSIKCGIPTALLLGIYRGEELLYIGRAGTGLRDQEWRKLAEFLPLLRQERPAFKNPPRGRQYCWIEPRLVVVVEFMEWTESFSLRAPVIIGFSKEDPKGCQL